ncbi:tryptophan-rich sensory protein [Ruania halotolerans]|uniref:tryptophan-rich sensory protein n=1 Tax=Ruania halotolerans TaxID=2897773 RepID=UPI001E54087B|nr:tryptophan-rich sensory protein [Ruania halotolerans]UFU06123.1 tryptophan-rich sensory protein [Ruania halotolerans]
MSHRILVTGATGNIGGLLVPRLLHAGHTVRVLTRSADRLPRAWRSQVDVVEGDATTASDLHKALDAVDVAYYLLHSMDGKGNLAARDREMAGGFAEAAREAGLKRIVYLSGLHPSGELSTHLSSRVEVGQVLLDSGVPTAVLQAATVLGAGSASFEMLRYLTSRLPVMVAPRWVENKIQPIGIDDVLHYLEAAADLPADVNRTFDVGGPEVLTYLEMMEGFAEVAGLRRRLVQAVPVLSPQLASHWIALVTPVDAAVAKPLVRSLVHEVICSENDLVDLVGPPPGGRTPYRKAVARALEDAPPDPGDAVRIWARTFGAVAACAALGTVLTNPRSRWYRRLSTPDWQPPGWAFPLVWTALYGTLATTSAAAQVSFTANGHHRLAREYEQALWVNLALNAGWSGLFFTAKKPTLALLDAALLTASSAGLARRASRAGRRYGIALAPYSLWCAFATALTGSMWRRNH